MAMESNNSMNYWRNYFGTANSDIFNIIEHAIMVAALDCPQEFRLRRDRIAERLFSCRLIRCLGCDREELAMPVDCEGEDEPRGSKNEPAGGSKESNVNSNRDDQGGEMNVNQIISNYSYDEAEALTDEIEEESQTLGEVLRIRDVLHNFEVESDSVLYDSLRRLQLMALSVDTLKATEIGRAVNGLKRHGSKQIRNLARTLIECWKVLVDEWVKATEDIKAVEGTPDSVNPSVVDDAEEEEGLPSPPLDEAFFATQPAAMELSQLFDGMDDDGNPQNGGEFIKNRENGRKPSDYNQNPMRQKQQTSNDENVRPKVQKEVQKQEAIVKPNKPSNTNSGPWRPPKPSAEQKLKNETKSQLKSDKVSIQRRPVTAPQAKLKSSDEAAVQVKLEATKRKLQESYQQLEKAKKQRTIQVMELHDLPKQGLGNRNPHMKPGSHNRHWGAQRRR